MEIGLSNKWLQVEDNNKLVLDLSTYTHDLPVTHGASKETFHKEFAENKDLIKDNMIDYFSNRILNMVATGDFKEDRNPIDVEASINTITESIAHSNNSVGTKFQVTLEHNNKENSPLEIIHSLRNHISEALADGFISSILDSVPESEMIH